MLTQSAHGNHGNMDPMKNANMLIRRFIPGYRYPSLNRKTSSILRTMNITQEKFMDINLPMRWQRWQYNQRMPKYGGIKLAINRGKMQAGVVRLMEKEKIQENFRGFLQMAHLKQQPIDIREFE